MTRRGVVAAGFVLSVLLSGSLAAGPSYAAPGGPGEFLKSLTDRAITQLTDPALPEEERRTRFRDLFRGNFDLPTISAFVLGRYWRSADEQTRGQFVKTFEDVMVDRFAPQFAGYGETRFQISGVRKAPGGQFLVSSVIKPPNGKTAQIDWRVRQAGSQFKIIDVIAEGVSMAQTLRSEYGSVLQRNSGDVGELITRLRSASTG